MPRFSNLRRLPPEVWALGSVSLLTDAASDMVYPLLPKLLVGLGAGAFALGVMEGVAELVASVVKIWAGHASDRSGRRGPFVTTGYGLAALSRPCLALVNAPWQVVLFRSVDRLGKGLRSAPRDAIIGRVTPAEHRGLAFGVHRAMDNLGAVFGPMIAFALLSWTHLEVRTVIGLAVIPGLLSTALAVVAVRREPKGAPVARDDPEEPRAPIRRGLRGLVDAIPPRARALLVATGLFALSASADSFLVARLSDLGLATAWLPIAWVTLQLGKSLLNVPGGALADRLGPRRVLIASWGIYALAYAAFALARGWAMFWAIFPLYAIHYGLGEGAEKSLMARMCPQERRGTAFGAQQAVHGAALLPANVVFGWLYVKHGAGAFGAAAAIAATATLVLLIVTRGETDAQAA